MADTDHNGRVNKGRVGGVNRAKKCFRPSRPYFFGKKRKGGGGGGREGRAAPPGLSTRSATGKEVLRLSYVF